MQRHPIGITSGDIVFAGRGALSSSGRPAVPTPKSDERAELETAVSMEPVVNIHRLTLGKSIRTKRRRTAFVVPPW